MKVNTKKREISENTIEDIEEEHLESISELTGLSLPFDNFKPLKSKNHSRDWKFPLEFRPGPWVCPLQQCTDECHECVNRDIGFRYFLHNQ